MVAGLDLESEQVSDKHVLNAVSHFLWVVGCGMGVVWGGGREGVFLDIETCNGLHGVENHPHGRQELDITDSCGLAAQGI